MKKYIKLPELIPHCAKHLLLDKIFIDIRDFCHYIVYELGENLFGDSDEALGWSWSIVDLRFKHNLKLEKEICEALIKTECEEFYLYDEINQQSYWSITFDEENQKYLLNFKEFEDYPQENVCLWYYSWETLQTELPILQQLCKKYNFDINYNIYSISNFGDFTIILKNDGTFQSHCSIEFKYDSLENFYACLLATMFAFMKDPNGDYIDLEIIIDDEVELDLTITEPIKGNLGKFLTNLRKKKNGIS